jgi:hypothetical protein
MSVLQGNGLARGIGSEDRGRGTSPRLRGERMDRNDEAGVCEGSGWNRNEAKERFGRKSGSMNDASRPSSVGSALN